MNIPGKYSWSLKQKSSEHIFYIGPPGSHVYFHVHSAAANALVFGKKLWLLLPPFIHWGPAVGEMDEWLDLPSSELPARPLVAIQGPGDVLFIPEGWSHATINLETSIGIAVQMVSQPLYCSSICFSPNPKTDIILGIYCHLIPNNFF